jgi:hypothetical protein
MLFMVIETFRSGTPDAVGERFRSHGRQIPEGSGVTYVTSWMAADGTRCFQVMEAPSRGSLDPWLSAWKDLVDFEVIPVKTSSDFWTHRA